MERMSDSNAIAHKLYMKSFSKNDNILYRNFDTFCYMNDNSSFGYKHVDTHGIHELIVSESGKNIISCLEYTPLSIYSIVNKLLLIYSDATYTELYDDVLDFLSDLASNNFIVCYDEEKNSKNIDFLFNYENTNEKHIVVNSTTNDFFYKYLKGKKYLKSVLIELTTICNERCVHCYIPHEQKNIILPFSKVKELLNCLEEMKVLNIVLTGGEPMMHPYFCEILSICREKRFSVNILSNLTCLSEEILEEIKRTPLISIQTSIYSMNPDVHDKITKCKGSLAKTMNGIEKLNNSGIPIQVNCPILSINKNYYEEVESWGKKNNIVVFTDYTVYAQYDGQNNNLNCRLSPDDVFEITLNKIKNDSAYRKQKIDDANSSTYFYEDLAICSACSENVCVSANGDVYPCSGWEEYRLGNIFKEHIEHIWNDSKSTNLIRGITIKDFPKCKECEDRAYCTICMMKNYNEDKNRNMYNPSDYVCKTTRIIKKIIEDS